MVQIMFTSTTLMLFARMFELIPLLDKKSITMPNLLIKTLASRPAILLASLLLTPSMHSHKTHLWCSNCLWTKGPWYPINVQFIGDLGVVVTCVMKFLI